jgi:4-amino-4-deoxy-L-arabinose transferase-like glycosyltransferase
MTMVVWMSRNLNSAAALVAAVALAAAATVLFHLSPQVPLGVPWDEPAKVTQIISDYNSFRHPILMLQAVRIANMWIGASEPASVLELGRAMAALSGGLLVLATIMLTRRAIGNSAALGAGVLVAVAPLTVLHSQLFKEDIFIAPWLIFGLLALDDLRQHPMARSAVLFGVAAGLAASAKYVGIILIPLCVLAPLWVKVRPSAYYRMVILAIGTALITFCIINFPLFLTSEIFLQALNHEIHHSLTRHLINHHGLYSNFTFTWKANLWPGLCVSLALAGVMGASIVIIQWRLSAPVLRTLIVFGLIWYFMHELSPAKPFPDGARHMTVMAAVFATLAAVAAHFVASSLQPRLMSVAAAAIIGGISIAPATRSFELVQSALSDTRIVVERLIRGFEGSVAWCQHGFENRAYNSLDVELLPLKVIEASADFLVVNELTAEIYLFSRMLPNQDQATKQAAGNYEALLRYPAIRVTSKVGYFAFRNPPIRIIALQRYTREFTMAMMRFGSVPDIELQIVSER